MTEPTDYQSPAADAKELAGAVLLPADLCPGAGENGRPARPGRHARPVRPGVGHGQRRRRELPCDGELILIERGANTRTPREQANLPTMFERCRCCPGCHCGPTRHVRRLCLSPRHPGEHLAGHHLRCHLPPAGTQPVLLPRRPGRPGQPGPHLRRPRQSHDEARRHEMNRPTICRTTRPTDRPVQMSLLPAAGAGANWRYRNVIYPAPT